MQRKQIKASASLSFAHVPLSPSILRWPTLFHYFGWLFIAQIEGLSWLPADVDATRLESYCHASWMIALADRPVRLRDSRLARLVGHRTRQPSYWVGTRSSGVGCSLMGLGRQHGARAELGKTTGAGVVDSNRLLWALWTDVRLELGRGTVAWSAKVLHWR